MEKKEGAGRVINFRVLRNDRLGSWEVFSLGDLVSCAASTIGRGFDWDADTWSQWTGLHDKNGVEIYEGDIAVRDGEQWIVAWVAEDVGFWFAEPNGKGRLNIGATCGEAEVVGNIYKNADIIRPTGNLSLLK